LLLVERARTSRRRAIHAAEPSAWLAAAGRACRSLLAPEDWPELPPIIKSLFNGT